MSKFEILHKFVRSIKTNESFYFLLSATGKQITGFFVQFSGFAQL